MFIKTETCICEDLEPLDTITVGPYIGQVHSLQQAIDEVTDGGIIYVKPNYPRTTPYFFGNIQITKNINIIGVEEYGYTPIIQLDTDYETLINIENSFNVHINNINFQCPSTNTNSIIIESNTNNLTLQDVGFSYCIPIQINSSLLDIPLDISINECTFNACTPKINLQNESSGSININNNSFSCCNLYIRNYNSNIYLSDNTFNRSGIEIQDLSQGIINLTHNTFETGLCILTVNQSKELNIIYNKFLSSELSFYNNDSQNILYLNKNWWGSIDGPNLNEDEFNYDGNIDFSNWSLDENFSKFHDEALQNASINGSVALRNCFNFNGVYAQLLNNNEVIKSSYTDDLGSFVFNDLYPNTYTLTLTKNGFDTVSEDVYASSENTILNYS